MRLTELDAILDFGVGCGRVARHWAGSGVDVHGCDYNPVLVEWCRRNLPHVTAASNGLDPPLSYENERFDFVYALSVFTHLTERQQRLWITELRRVTRPGGLVLFTTHGPALRFSDPAWPTPEILQRLADGELVVTLPSTPAAMRAPRCIRARGCRSTCLPGSTCSSTPRMAPR